MKSIPKSPSAGHPPRSRPVLHVELDDHECGNSKRNPGLPDRGEAAAAPDDPFAVFEQGNLPP
ncbi:hypothetical protein PSEUDO8AS_60223 [Pseudomonas sp. 8AS]|nr:hypothetical protein PSEUDO8AS_60223 [Pseudomonas sp. 8AS]